MTADILAPLMFVVIFAIIFVGYPVAFALGGTSLVFAFIGVQAGIFPGGLLLAMPERVFGIMSNSVLLAVPYFIFMGLVLERAKLAEDLLTTIGQLFGAIRGGLALGVVIVGAMLAAATGIVGASVVAMGSISLPVMLRYNYDKRLASGVILASGTLGQIIPPSIVLVVLADQLGVPVGDLFIGSLIPGLMLASLYGVYVVTASWLKPTWGPALPAEMRTDTAGALGMRVVLVLMPPLLLILIVLGSIFAGIATPTEAGAVGSVGAMLLALTRGRLNWDVIGHSCRETAKLTTMVVFLLIGSTAFALVFRGLDGDFLIRDLLTNLPGGRIGLLIVANLAIFILGFFLDFFEIAFIVIPLIVPAAELLGIDLVWFGVMIGMNLQTSFLTPPFGFALFYLRGVAPPEVETTDLYRAAIPFIVIQLIGLYLIIQWPGLVTGLIN